VRAKLLAREVPRLRRADRVRSSTILGGLVAAAGILVAVFFAWPRPGHDERAHGFHASKVKEAPPVTAGAPFVVGEGDAQRPGTAGAFIAASPGTEMPLTFSDGSKVRLAPAARVRVTEVAN
jgi:hypothetical protein